MDQKQKHCLSCNHPLSDKDKYCPNCGLETVYRNLSLRFLMRSFFEAFLNFDVKMLHSMRDIWIPNKITKTFLEGKREYHVHPFRFYFICLIAFFALLSVSTKNLNMDGLHLSDTISKFELYYKFDTISNNYDDECSAGILDSIKNEIYTGQKDLDRDTFFNLEIFGSDLSDYGVSTMDAYNMDMPDIFEKYNVTKKKDQYLLTQYKRVVISPESAIRFAIGNMIWGLILLTIIMAGVLKLLYIRHECYYIEHLLHIANFHCLTALLFSIVMIINLIFPHKALLGSLIIIVSLGTIFYLLVGLNRYYREPIFRTAVKSLIIGTFYWLAIGIIMLLIALLSFVIF